jgi:hypothetical protein
MHNLACFIALLGAAASAQAQAAPAKRAEPAKTAARAAPPTASAALLPDSFAGWVASEPLRTLTDPAQADPANAAALKEYDFTDAALASYKRGGETLSLRALRFHDASGAYGAYSFYRQNGWPKEEIGSGATSNHNRVLFWLGNTVVDANFSHIGPMSGSELRELASHLPVPGGNRAIAPPILSDLPKDSLDGQTTHYALGPARPGWLRSRRRGRDRKLLAAFQYGHAHPHQLPHAADGRGPGKQNSRLHQGGQSGAAAVAAAAEGFRPGLA